MVAASKVSSLVKRGAHGVLGLLMGQSRRGYVMLPTGRIKLRKGMNDMC